MSFKRIVILISALILLASCAKDKMPVLIELDNQLRLNIQTVSPDGSTDYYILPDETDLANIPQDPKNVLTPEKVALGKFLFYETALAQDARKQSGMGTYSCASCHIPEAGFRPGNYQGIADGGTGFGINGEDRLKNPEYQEDELDVQSARALNLLNVAYVTNTFWNGQFGATGVNEGTEELWDNDHATELNHLGFSGIETQNIEGLDVHRITINKPLLDELGYTPLFDAAFPDVDASERYTRFTASFAYSAYIRSLLSNKAPFQDWLKGNQSAMNYTEKKGAILFFGKAQCFQCHFEPNLGSSEFHALGVNDMYQIPSFNSSATDPRNLGRGAFTLKEEDNYKFKVPGIYNMSDTPFYFHGSSVRSLEALVEYKNDALTQNPNVPQELISDKFNKIFLSEEEKAHLVDFLATGLRDPELTRYKPASVLSGNCFPNNDYQSRIELGCN